jgi:hypothetical protein
MKALIVVFLFLAGSFATQAQSSSPSAEQSGVLVLKYSWTKERVGWEQDPFGGPIENFDEMRVRARNDKRIQDAKRGGNGAEISKAERDARTDNALISTIHKNNWARYGFSYKVSVQNNAAIPIKSIDWDYVFFDLQTESELGRRQFTSDQKISPGKTRELKFFIPNPPTKTISVNALNSNERASLGEKVVIVRVAFADGSVWLHP